MPKKMTFEAALEELERTVDALERGDLSLEESLAKFEEGVKLAGQCADLVNKAPGEHCHIDALSTLIAPYEQRADHTP